jgi:acetyl esterase/lipase
VRFNHTCFIEVARALEGLYDKGLTKEQIASPDRSPLMVENFEGLPRAVMCVGGQDPLRDEGLLYAELLKKANGEDSVRLNMRASLYFSWILKLIGHPPTVIQTRFTRSSLRFRSLVRRRSW